jgi:hypothetical protein
MSYLVINNAYFTKNIYVSTIDISNTLFLNITNMSVTGDISMNTTYVSSKLNTNTISTKNNGLIQFNNAIINSATKTSASIGFTNIVTNSVNYTLLTIATKQTPITISSLPAGVYAFDYSYNILSNSNTATLFQLYEYIDNTTTNANLLTKGNTLIFSSSVNTNGNQYNSTYGVLTSPTNTITFSILCSVVSPPTINFTGFYFRYTRIA